MKKCKNYKKYQATKAPTCGCDGCKEKWRVALNDMTPFERWYQDGNNLPNCKIAWDACKAECLKILENRFTTIYDNSDEYCYNGTEAIEREAYDDVQKL